MYRDISNRQSEKSVAMNFRDLEIADESRLIVEKILAENETLKSILFASDHLEDVYSRLREWIMDYFSEHNDALLYYKGEIKGKEVLDKLSWQDFAAIRILDYIDHEGDLYEDMNVKGQFIVNSPFRLLWMAAREGNGGASSDFFRDILHLFRQFSGREKRILPKKEQILEWMDRHPSGLDPAVIEQRKKNRDRIIRLFIKKIDAGDIDRQRFRFEPDMTYWQKYKRVLEWWNNHIFHLQFAARTPERLNRMLGRTLDEKTMNLLIRAQDSGIPFFVNPYYLTLLNADEADHLKFADQAIRDYVMVSEELVNEFGEIVAWEKEDIVEPGIPNAAGWILPHHKNIHRRYPEVAILIPDTAGRACGGLCVSCQRMYDFQNGHLNFDLDELKPVETWWDRLPKLLDYFEKDAQLRDILITGGDALMNSDKTLSRILDEVYNMAYRKREANKRRSEGEKLAEMQRIRLGTRLPVYLPQRITDSLIDILASFKQKASAIGFKQFVIQTHYESAMEVTPESAKAIRKLISAGWIITNQMVFTAAASRRGHASKLRKVLNDIGVLSYYTFTVKGFKENVHSFANNARIVQEQIEEKVVGSVPEKYTDLINIFPNYAEDMFDNIESLRRICDIPFLATDRNVLNLPGVGKSLTFRTIGITPDGRRILQFDHDHNRSHSPIIDLMGKVIIIESKSIARYLKQIESIGENLQDNKNIWGYSLSETEPRMSIYQYPEQSIEITEELSNLEV